MVKIASVNLVKRKTDLREVTDSEGNKYIVSCDILTINGLEEGKEFSESEWDNIIISSDRERGFEYSIDYLSRGMRTEKELKDKLKERKIHYKAASEIIRRLKELDYINDEKYAIDYINYYSSSRGKIRLRNELYLKGVEKNLIDEALSTFEDEEKSCLEIAKKFSKGVSPYGKEKEKLIRYLLSRGYGYEIIRDAIKNLGGDTDDLQDL